MWDKWVIDATLQHLTDEIMVPGTFCFVPFEEPDTYVVGMNYIGSKPPHGGKVVAVIHEGGQEAVDKFVEDHKSEIEALIHVDS